MRPRLLLIAAALPLLLPPVARADVSPTPSPGAGSGLPVAVTLTTVRPFAPQPHGVMHLAGRLRNVGATPVPDVRVQLLIGSGGIGSRGEFDAYAATPDGPPPTGAVAASAAVVTLPDSVLAIGGSERFSIDVPVDSLSGVLVSPWRVYELAVVVTGTTPVGAGQVGRLRTFLPWAPADATGVGVRTRVAWLWPLVDRPHRSAGATWADDELATALSAGHRLANLLAAGRRAQDQHSPPPRHPSKRRAGKRPAPTRLQPLRVPTQPVPVTWVLDPMLVDDVTAMAAGYTVGANATAGTGRAAARAWGSALRTAVQGRPVVALPYADPDVTALTRAGMQAQVPVATHTGEALLASQLGVQPLPYGWPVDGMTDQHGLDAAFASGRTAVVLDDTALPVVTADTGETPSAHALVSSRDAPLPLDALLTDHTLDTAIAAGATTPAEGALDVQRVLSELLMIQAEYPADARDVVLAPPRRWDPAAGFASTLLAATGKVPWVQPVGLDQVAADPVYRKVERGPLRYPADARAAELPQSFLRAVAAVKREADAFASILPPGNAAAAGFESGVLRLTSSAWRDDPAGAQALTQSLATAVRGAMSKVFISPYARGSLVTLTSHSGTVPVTVGNDLDSPVTVLIAIDAGGHLQVAGSRTMRTIPPHRQVAIDVRVTARTSGTFPLTVRLLTPTHPPQAYGRPRELSVRSTAYGAAALAVTGGATLALLIAVVVRLVRRTRAARRAAPAVE